LDNEILYREEKFVHVSPFLHANVLQLVVSIGLLAIDFVSNKL
jgi:hypothetical protein